jgi:8-oxo-dGTP pyrophosphatase MutT (NUDIX family)
MIRPWREVAREGLGSFKVFDLRKVRRVSPRTGAELDFFVIHTMDWVNVVPFTEDGRMVLVRQFRHGPERATLEIPGGIIHGSDEDPADAAIRELREESGYACGELIHLGQVNPNPALFTNTCYTYLALGCRLVGELIPDPGEDLEVELLAEAEVARRTASGEIDHALVLAAFHWLALYRAGTLAAKKVR